MMKMPDDNQSRQTIIAKEGSTVKNVIQAIIHLPTWAWMVGVVILSISLLAVAAIFNVGPLQELLPTPTAFAPATPDQSLIIVADFDNRSNGKYTGVDPAQYVYEQLVGQAQKDDLDARIERLYQVVNDNTAKTTGTKYNATLVVWGWYDTLTITPRMARIKTLEGTISDQEGLRLSLADPDKVEFSVVTDLPSQASYLVMFTLGMDKYSNSIFEEAQVYFDNAIKAVGENSDKSTNPAESYFYSAYIFYEQGQTDRALDYLNKTIQLKPDFAMAYNNRGVTYANQGDYEQAIADFSKDIELQPDDATTYYNRGTIHDANGDYDLGISDLSKAIQIRSDFANAYANRGNAYFHKGDFDSAIADYDKALSLKSNLPAVAQSMVYSNRGVAYNNKEDNKRALVDFDMAIQIDPNYADAYFNRARVYLMQGDKDRAIADFDKFIQLRPDDAASYFFRGWIYYSKGDYDRAIADYGKAIQLNPDYLDANNNRCWTYYETGQYENALPDCEKAVELAPDNPYVLDSRASVYEALGRTDEAIKDFERILELSTDPELRKRAEEELKKLKGQ